MSSKKQMLIVDDNRALREALKAVFEDEYELSFAEDGREALREYRQRAPQVVLMDYQMPGMDGLETLQHMQPQASGSRVVMMSAHHDLSTETVAKRYGASDFVGKPFNVEELKTIVNQTSRTARVRERAARAQAMPAPVITQNELSDLINSTLRLVAC